MTIGLKLPEKLLAYQDLISIGVTQWSKIAAWTWTDYLAFEGKDNEKDEIDLKKVLIDILQKQAIYQQAYIAYGDANSKKKADDYSRDLDNLMLSENSEVPLAQNIKLSLSALLIEITGQALVTTKYSRFTHLVSHRVITNSFAGGFEEIPEELRDNPGQMFYSYVAYPPRPAFSPEIERKVKNWAKDPNKNPDPYLPDFTAYLPLAVS